MLRCSKGLSLLCWFPCCCWWPFVLHSSKRALKTSTNRKQAWCPYKMRTVPYSANTFFFLKHLWSRSGSSKFTKPWSCWFPVRSIFFGPMKLTLSWNSNFVFQTTSLNFILNYWRKRYDPRNIVNWSDSSWITANHSSVQNANFMEATSGTCF